MEFLVSHININENQLKTSGKNFVILRLGSVYGYSTDSMRIDIMPNLFSKITSQNGTLKLFYVNNIGKELDNKPGWIISTLDINLFNQKEERDSIIYVFPLRNQDRLAIT